MRHIIGVDLGGTQLRAILATEQGAVLAETRTPTLAQEGPQRVIERMLGCIEAVRQACPPGTTVAGIGIGAPGPLDPFEGTMLGPPNLPGWQNIPLRTIIEQQTGLPVELGNDANAAALGEWRFGAGQGYRNLVYVTISTGIGGGVICDGRLLLGHRGAAAEIGFMIIQAAGRLVWEELASGTALAREAAQVLATEVQTRIRALAADAPVTAAHVAQAGIEGDPVALALLDKEGELLGVGLVNVLHLFSPEIVLLGGGVMQAADLLLARAQRVVQERAMEIYRDIPIRLAALGERVGLLGAVALFLERPPLNTLEAG